MTDHAVGPGGSINSLNLFYPFFHQICPLPSYAIVKDGDDREAILFKIRSDKSPAEDTENSNRSMALCLEPFYPLFTLISK